MFKQIWQVSAEMQCARREEKAAGEEEEETVAVTACKVDEEKEKGEKARQE